MTLVVIPVFMREPSDLALTLKTVKTVRDADPDVGVLLVDDRSPAQGLVDELAGKRARLQFDLRRNDQNRGFSYTANVGLKMARSTGEDAILLNADIEVITPDFSRIMREQPADVVGALLTYPPGELIQHAGVFFCQPPDEEVLTVRHGYVPIAELDPEQHGLVSYARKENRIFRAATQAGRSADGRQLGEGYPFRVGSRPYIGELLAIGTQVGTTRVTPNHKMTAFWTEEALNSYAVYLMRRGRHWRIGHIKMTHGGTATSGRGRSFGPRMRMEAERADAVWLLKVCHDKDEAIYLEALLSWQYRVPTWQFIAHGKTKGANQDRLNYLWGQVDSEAGARAVLSAFGRHPDYPLLWGKGMGIKRHPIGVGRRHPIHAANLLPAHMRLPVDPGSGQTPMIVQFTLDRELYAGDVYSMDVHPHEHYISGGIVVHNSFLVRIFDHRFRYAPKWLPEANVPHRCPVTAAFQYISNDCLRDVGLYDERYKMAWEDVHYCLRVFRSGRECLYCPEVEAIHHESMFRGRADRKITDWQAHSFKMLMQDIRGVNLSEFVPELV